MVSRDSIRAIHQSLNILGRRIRLLVNQVGLLMIDDSAKLQRVQLNALEGEVADKANRYQNYGFTSVPHPGAQGVAASLMGSRAQIAVLVMDDARYRKRGLGEGEVSMYTSEGDYILMKRGRIIEVVAGAKLDVTAPEVDVKASTSAKVTSPKVDVVAAAKVTLTTPLCEITGDVAIGGNLAVAGGISGAGAAGATIAGPLKSDTSVSDLNGSMQEMRGIYNGHGHPDDSGGTTGTPNASMS